MNKGIYQITNTSNGKCYIGASIDVKGRLRTHKRQLNNGKHKVSELQRDYSLAPSDFVFKHIEVVDDSSLIKEREQAHIGYHDSVYNQTLTSGYSSERSRTVILKSEHLRSVHSEIKSLKQALEKMWRFENELRSVRREKNRLEAELRKVKNTPGVKDCLNRESQAVQKLHEQAAMTFESLFQYKTPDCNRTLEKTIY